MRNRYAHNSRTRRADRWVLVATRESRFRAEARAKEIDKVTEVRQMPSGSFGVYAKQ